MNTKKAKALRKTAKMLGLYDPTKETQYKIVEHKKMVSFIDPKGQPQMVPVVRKQLLNATKFGLKRLTQAYENGEIGLFSLKELNSMTPEELRAAYQGE